MLLLAAPWLLGCQDYALQTVQDVEGSEHGLESGADPQRAEDLGWPELHELSRCPPSEETAGEVEILPFCENELERADIYVITEWLHTEFGQFPEYNQVVMTPVLGHLRDDNGDGVLGGEGDTPELAFITDDEDEENSHGVLRILTATGEDHCDSVDVWLHESDQLFPYRYSGIAIGDADADGEPELAMVVELMPGEPGDVEGEIPDSTPPPEHDDTGEVLGPISRAPEMKDRMCALALIEADLSVQWVARDQVFACGGHAPSMADLDADGLPEVIVGGLIVDGESGELQGWGAGHQGSFNAYDEIGSLSFAADLDGDGYQELIAGSTLYDPEGQAICSLEGGSDGFAAAADLDGDAYGEVVVVGEGKVSIMQHDCALGLQWELPGGGNGGPPTVGDFDGDGEPEIGIADALMYTVFEADGTALWSREITDESSHATGSSVYDFNGDGRAEVLYADEVALWIYDGPTGEVLVEDSQHASRTLHEYPIIGDVDGDGATEIVVPNGGGHQGENKRGLYVLGSLTEPWVSSRPVWNQHAYSITNIGDDLSIPQHPDPNWPTYNTFRSGDLTPVTGSLAPDLTLELVSICRDCVKGVTWVELRVINQGGVSARKGVALSLSSVDSAGVSLEHHRLELERSLAPGSSTPPVRFALPTEDFPEGIAQWVIDAPEEAGLSEGRVRECLEQNNSLLIRDGLCQLREEPSGAED